jgi:hypothetical protein
MKYSESERIWKETIVALIEVPSRHFPRGTEEDYEKPQFGVPEEILTEHLSKELYLQTITFGAHILLHFLTDVSVILLCYISAGIAFPRHISCGMCHFLSCVCLNVFYYFSGSSCSCKLSV